MTAPSIILVEDDPPLRTLTARALQEHGYEVRPASSGPEMWVAFDAGPVDLVVLDVMLPGTNGIDLCRQIRRKSDVPIIFISAKGSETDRIVGLELGADDYLPKPFGTRELIARIRAILRRVGLERGPDEHRENEARFDGWVVNFPRRELRSPTGGLVDLTGAEFDLLGSFLSHPQRVIARERLIELSRTRMGDSSDRSIDVLVSRLRRKLSTEDRGAPITTVRGVGYMFNAEVSRAWWHMHGSLGLVGRLFAILLLTLTLEFAVGTLIYERASQISLQDDEARRLAEHLVIARKLLTEQPPAERRAMGVQLTTDRYDVHWSAASPPPPPLSPELERMRQQIIAWEPTLERSRLWLRLTSPSRHSEINGGLQLPDGSWLYFGMHHGGGKWAFTIGRMGLALIPVLALLVAGWILIRRTLAPLRELTRATEKIGLGAEVILPEAGTSDVRELIRAFNAMQTRIHRLINERTETLAAVGHDLRTPLSRLQLRLETVRQDDVREAMDGDLEEMGAMIESLLDFLGGEKNPEPLVRADLAVTIATVVDAFQDHGQDVDYSGPDHLEMEIHALSLRRAVRNLIENALHWAAGARLPAAGGGRVLIRIDDDGPGIPRDQIGEVLKPFARLDTARQRNTRGLGLGLAIVQKAVELERAQLTLINRPEGGLRAEICLQRPKNVRR